MMKGKNTGILFIYQAAFINFVLFVINTVQLLWKVLYSQLFF